MDEYVYVFVSKDSGNDCIWCKEEELPEYMNSWKKFWHKLYVERVPVGSKRIKGPNYKKLTPS